MNLVHRQLLGTAAGTEAQNHCSGKSYLRHGVRHSRPHQLTPPDARASTSRDHSETTDAPVRSLVSSTYTVSQRSKAHSNPIADFYKKVQLAWRIFFPDKQKDVSPKEEVKRRLRMVLVADRCGMSPASMSEMKRTIIRALQDYVDIEGEEGIQVSVTSEPGLGTVYSVNIPVRRVKAEARFTDQGVMEGTPDGVMLEWDPMDWHSDPSSRFPMGC